MQEIASEYIQQNSVALRWYRRRCQQQQPQLQKPFKRSQFPTLVEEPEPARVTVPFSPAVPAEPPSLSEEDSSDSNVDNDDDDDGEDSEDGDDEDDDDGENWANRDF